MSRPGLVFVLFLYTVVEVVVDEVVVVEVVVVSVVVGLGGLVVVVVEVGAGEVQVAPGAPLGRVVSPVNTPKPGYTLASAKTSTLPSR